MQMSIARPDFRSTLVWMPVAFVLAGLAAAIAFGFYGTGEFGLAQALRITGRVSFLFFWLAYVGSVLRQARMPVLAFLAGRRREFGLAFLAAHSVHVLIIVWRYRIGFPSSPAVLVVDGIGILWMYVLGALSFGAVCRTLSPVVLRVLFNCGLEYIAIVFLSDFLLGRFAGGRAFSIAYLPFTVLLVAAAAVRWLMAAHRLYAWFGTKRARNRYLPEADIANAMQQPRS